MHQHAQNQTQSGQQVKRRSETTGVVIFDLEEMPEDSSVGAKLLWAGRAARELTETETFVKFFSDVDIKPNWCASALTYILHKDAEFNALIQNKRYEQDWIKIIRHRPTTGPQRENARLAANFFIVSKLGHIKRSIFYVIHRFFDKKITIYPVMDVS